MRRIMIGFAALLITGSFLNSCRKSAENVAPAAPANDLSSLHGLGLNPMEPSDWANVPVFSAALFKNNLQTNGLQYNGPAYSSYLLVSPQVRDRDN